MIIASGAASSTLRARSGAAESIEEDPPSAEYHLVGVILAIRREARSANEAAIGMIE
jgi:hypothetical protein